MQALCVALLCGLDLLAPPHRATARDWGTIKGQAVCPDPKALKPKQLKIATDCKECLKNGPILSERYVVNPKNKGVRWVVVWLAKDTGGKADHDAALPIHPDLKKIKVKEVVMDIPCCRFEPHVAVLRQGQGFVVRNSSKPLHNVKVVGRKGPPRRTFVDPDRDFRFSADEWKPDYLPRTATCSIHPWMQGIVFCFAHPYFAVTDAEGRFEIRKVPAGKYRLIAWHEGIGWVAGDDAPGKNGKAIAVQGGQMTDVGKLSVKYND